MPARTGGRSFFDAMLVVALAVAALPAFGCRSGGEHRQAAAPSVAPPAATEGATEASQPADAGQPDAVAPPLAETPRPRASSGDLVDIDDVDTRPVLVHREPAQASDPRRGGTSGRVTVRALINEQGTVDDVEVLSAPPTLREFAGDVQAAVRKWRFTPAMKDGLPVQVWYVVTTTIEWR